MTELPVTRGAGWSGTRGVEAFLRRGREGLILGADSAAAGPGLHAQVLQGNRRNQEIRKVFGKEWSV